MSIGQYTARITEQTYLYRRRKQLVLGFKDSHSQPDEREIDSK